MHLLAPRQPTDSITIVKGTEIFSTPGIYTWIIRILETAEDGNSYALAFGVASGGGSARASNVLTATAANRAAFSGPNVWMFDIGGSLYTTVGDNLDTALSPVSPSYSPETIAQGSEIEVRLHIRKGQASLRVQADGIGEFYYGNIGVEEPLCPCMMLPSKGIKVEILA